MWSTAKGKNHHSESINNYWRSTHMLHMMTWIFATISNVLQPTILSKWRKLERGICVKLKLMKSTNNYLSNPDWQIFDHAMDTLTCRLISPVRTCQNYRCCSWDRRLTERFDLISKVEIDITVWEFSTRSYEMHNYVRVRMNIKVSIVTGSPSE